MAAEIRAFHAANNASQHVQLLANLEGHQDTVNKARILSTCEGVISISDDKTTIIWQKRDTGVYWPSVCHMMPSPPTCLSLSEETNKVYIGMDNGSISEFIIGEDFNKLTFERNFLQHTGRVTDLYYSPSHHWIVSVGKDKVFTWLCTETGRRLGTYVCTAPCTSLQFDEPSKYAFIGDMSGEITMLKLNEQSCSKVTSLKGHSAAVRCLAWDVQKQMLYSVSSDQVIICWDIGGKCGTAYELQGHSGRISSVCFSSQPQLLLSGGEDRMVISWNMHVKRKETPNWLESDHCQRCNRPFFWNIKAMVDQKTIGLRQHHCRKCGKAICDACSINRSCIPIMGFEFKVRVCDDCFSTITDQDRISMAKFHDSKHSILDMHLDERKKLLLTCGSNRIIKLWDIAGLCELSK